MTINNVLLSISSVVGNVSGIKKSDYPPTEQQNEYPFSVVYFQSGVLEAAPVGSKKNIFSVAVEVLTKKIKLQEDLTHVNPFLDSVPSALLAEVSVGGSQFSGTIQTFKSLYIEFLPDYVYSGVSMIGYRFTLLDIKTLTAL